MRLLLMIGEIRRIWMTNIIVILTRLVLMTVLRREIKREEHIMVVLVPRATDEWLNGVPVGILSLAFAPLHCGNALQFKAMYKTQLSCAFQCVGFFSLLHWLVPLEVAKQHDRHVQSRKHEIVNLRFWSKHCFFAFFSWEISVQHMHGRHHTISVYMIHWIGLHISDWTVDIALSIKLNWIDWVGQFRLDIAFVN